MKGSDLKTLSNNLRKCRHCAERFAKTQTSHSPNPVFQFSSEARVCIAGQAPGLLAHQSSKPFTDPSGTRLRTWLGVDDTVFYDETKLAIVPMAFCFPGYNKNKSDLPPPPICAKKWRDHVFDAMPQIELIVLVGKSALAWHLPHLRRAPLRDTVRGGIVAGMPSILPLPHPSWRNNTWLKANPWFETDILPILRAEVARLVS